MNNTPLVPYSDLEWFWLTVPNDGELRSAVLGGLRFFVDGNRLRARDAEGTVLLSDEEAAEQESARATREAIRAAHEAARADAAEAELRRLKARYGIPEKGC